MNNFNIKTNISPLVLNAFNNLYDHDQIINFMMYFFMEYVKGLPDLKDYGFKKALDEVNKQLMQPVNNLTIARRKVSEDETRRIRIWHKAFSEYESKILQYLIKIGYK